MGQSTIDDIDEMFNTALGFNGGYSFRLDQHRIDFETETFAAGHNWSIPGVGEFFIDAHVGQDDEILKALLLYSDLNQPYFDRSPNRVIKELGAPTTILLAISPTEATEYVMDMMLVYESGMVFYYQTRLPSIEVVKNGKIDSITVEVCFSGPGLGGLVYIMEPIPQQLPEEVDQLSPIQYQWFGSTIKAKNLSSISTYFDLTDSALVERVQNEENTCITTQNLFHR